jgi:hypothetical protein
MRQRDHFRFSLEVNGKPCWARTHHRARNPEQTANTCQLLNAIAGQNEVHFDPGPPGNGLLTDEKGASRGHVLGQHVKCLCLFRAHLLDRGSEPELESLILSSFTSDHQSKCLLGLGAMSMSDAPGASLTETDHKVWEALSSSY